MEGDEDFEEKELNYKKFCKDIIRTLNKIKANLRIFNKFNLKDYQKKDLMEVSERLENLNYPEYNNQTFIELMDISCQLGDLLGEIDSVFKNLIKKINSSSESDKKKMYSYFKIEKITPKLIKSSNEFNSNLHEMSKLIQKIIDKYLSYYKEE